jgi:hypothetical protein
VALFDTGNHAGSRSRVFGSPAIEGIDDRAVALARKDFIFFLPDALGRNVRISSGLTVGFATADLPPGFAVWVRMLFCRFCRFVRRFSKLREILFRKSGQTRFASGVDLHPRLST